MSTPRPRQPESRPRADSSNKSSCGWPSCDSSSSSQSCWDQPEAKGNSCGCLSCRSNSCNMRPTPVVDLLSGSSSLLKSSCITAVIWASQQLWPTAWQFLVWKLLSKLCRGCRVGTAASCLLLNECQLFYHLLNEWCQLLNNLLNECQLFYHLLNECV